LTPEARFLAVSCIGIAYFASELVFRSTTSAHAREWRDSKHFSILQILERFERMLSLAANVWAMLLLMVASSFVVLLLFLEIVPGMVLAAIAAGIFFFLAVQRSMEAYCEWQAARFEERLADAIDIMSAALSAGATPAGAIEAVVRWTEGKISREFEEVLRRLELGLDIEQALDRMIRLYDSEGVRLFSQALRVKWYVGGDLAEILQVSNRIIRERNRMRIQSSGQMSGIRYAALFVACMPHVLYACQLILQPQWVAAIHADALGAQLIYAALALQIIGLFWLSRILRHEE